MKELFSSFSFIFNYFNTQPLEEKNPRTSKASQVAAASAGSLTSLTSSSSIWQCWPTLIAFDEVICKQQPPLHKPINPFPFPLTSASTILSTQPPSSQPSTPLPPILDLSPHLLLIILPTNKQSRPINTPSLSLNNDASKHFLTTSNQSSQAPEIE